MDIKEIQNLIKFENHLKLFTVQISVIIIGRFGACHDNLIINVKSILKMIEATHQMAINN